MGKYYQNVFDIGLNRGKASIAESFITPDKIWYFEQAEKQKKALLEFEERRKKTVKMGEELNAAHAVED